MQIEWFPVCGFEGLYEWSPTLEAVRSVNRHGTKGKVLQWNYKSNGRPFVYLCKNGKRRYFAKAMLIYSHAHQVEIPLGFDVHHINGCWTDNKIENLQLLTAEEHRKIHGLNEKAVVAVDDKGNVVYRFPSICEAVRNGFSQGGVSCACRGCYSTHRGHYYKGLYWWYEQEWLELQQP